MSVYTTELRFMLENQEWTDDRLGLSDYPIFEESYRPTLNKKIKDHFYFQEIGFETPARFAFYLGQKMREIMPTYNQMYKTFEGVNWLENINITQHDTGERREDVDETGKTTSGEIGDITSHQVSNTTSEDTSASTDLITATTSEYGTIENSGNDTDRHTTTYEGSEENKRTGKEHHKINGSYKIETDHGEQNHHNLQINAIPPAGLIDETDLGENDHYASSAIRNRDRNDKYIDRELHDYETGDEYDECIDYTPEGLTDTKLFIGRKDDYTGEVGRKNKEERDIDSSTIKNTSHSTTANAESTDDKTTTEETTKNTREDLKKKRNLTGENDNWLVKHGLDGVLPVDVLERLQQHIIDVDRMVIKELEVLFMAVY